MTYVQGIRENWRQFVLQLMMVFAVGLTIGSERTVVPVLGRESFGLESILVIGSFVLSFGFVKALLNLYGGKWADEYGRKPILVAGWILALPIPVILALAPNWWWVTVGNVLLGVNQGLAWSMSVNAKIDLAGDEARGLAWVSTRRSATVALQLAGGSPASSPRRTAFARNRSISSQPLS